MKRFDPKKLQEAIDEAGLSTRKFAGHLMALGYLTCRNPREAVRVWLEGKHMPGSTNLAGMSVVLRKPTDYFFTEVPDENPDAEYEGKQERALQLEEEKAERKASQTAREEDSLAFRK